MKGTKNQDFTANYREERSLASFAKGKAFPLPHSEIRVPHFPLLV